MARISQLGRVIVPVSDQDEAIAFYTEKLGFTVSADVPYGEGDRWVEVTPPGGGSARTCIATGGSTPRRRCWSGSPAAGWIRGRTSGT